MRTRRAGVIVLAGGLALPDAPTLADSLPTPFPTSTTSHAFATSGLDVAGLSVFAAIVTNGGSTAITSFQGADDTSASVVAYTAAAPQTHLREMTIVSSLDATWTLLLSASARPCICGLSIADLVSRFTQENHGTGGSPANSALGVTGGPHNLLVIDILGIRGAHVTNPPLAPAGYSLVTAIASNTDDPANTAKTTLAIAQRTFASTDLSWTGDAATVPAATWLGLADLASNPWAALRIVGAPS